MNENINLCEILKDCPKGTKLYSSIFGEVEFQEVTKGNEYPIVVSTNNIIDEEREQVKFASDGKFWAEHKDAECVLFPSKDCRDWSKFKISKTKFDIKTLKPFDKVLVRDECEDIWRCNFYSYYENTNFPFVCVYSFYKQSIPYNDETKHLVGTNQTPPEFYDKCWEIDQRL